MVLDLDEKCDFCGNPVDECTCDEPEEEEADDEDL